MYSFEEFLVDKGYRCYSITIKNDVQVECPPCREFSIMMNLDRRFEKDGVEFIYGLHEAHHPPTICYPRPKVLIDDKPPIGDYVDDDIMNRIIQKYSNEEIYDSIMNDKTLHL